MVSPARRAIGTAAVVVVVALALYSIAAALDRWPELVVVGWGAALGAGMAVNGIALREMDFSDDLTTASATSWSAPVQHQIAVVLVAFSAWRTAADEQFGWAAATVAAGAVWALTLYRLAGAIETVDREHAVRAYSRAFYFLAILFAICVIYASVALESRWLWRPAVPADLQWLVWFTILEFTSLPLTFAVLRS